jgi:DNA-3-methyladenine glycosylase II
MKNKSSDALVFDHFNKVSPDLVNIFKDINFDDWFGTEILEENLIFRTLCKTIVGQQLAGKAADAIFARFEVLCNKNIVPEIILKIEDQKIRDVGLSWAKVRSVKDLATKVVNADLVLSNLEKLGDEELIEELSKVKGIGRWTAEMFLMFRLRREDVFSWGDLGLKNGLKKYLNNPEASMAEMETVVSKWAPFRTYGAIAMWHLLDNR